MKAMNIIPTCDLSIIIPLLNEADSLHELYERCRIEVNALDLSYEFIFIDDGSTDNSAAIIQELHQQDPHIKLIQFRHNYGKAAGLAIGFEAANGAIVITMDADLQDDPAEIPNLIAKINDGWDLVSGWKKKRKDPLTKRLPSKVFNYVTAKVTGLKIHDANCGLKAYRYEVAKTVYPYLYGELHRYIPVLAHMEGFRVTETVVVHHPRKYGISKYGMWRFFSGFFDLTTVVFLNRYTKRPLHFFGILGLITWATASLIALYFFWVWLNEGALRVRPMLLFAGFLAVIGVQFFSMGLLGEMITRFRQTPHTADYLIKNRLGFTK